MTTGFDLDEIERLLAAATGGGAWALRRVMDKTFRVRTEAGTFVAVVTHEQDAALIVTLKRSAPAMIAEIRELRAENARLRGVIQHRGGPLCPARYSDAAACNCGVFAALGEPQ